MTNNEVQVANLRVRAIELASNLRPLTSTGLAMKETQDAFENRTQRIADFLITGEWEKKNG
jgi:hypothetical protein